MITHRQKVQVRSMIIVGDAIEVLRKIKSESVDCCVTSPPYYNLRDYGIEGQIGLETTPEEYISKLVDVFREVWRVLKQDGTLWLNIGDSYAGSGKGKKDTHTTNMGNKGTLNNSALQGNFRSAAIKPKDLIGIPWLLAFSLRADGWYLRQDIIWQKPNCMPESVRDRCTKSHEYIFLLSKSPKYYFDGEAISEPIADSTVKRCSQNIAAQKGSDRQPGKSNGNMKACLPRFGGEKYAEGSIRTKSGNIYIPSLRRNKRDVWTVSTAGFKGAHFAVFPEKLIEPCVLAGCKEGGTVLDPFCGSGTVGEAAKIYGRSFIGIELNPQYAEIAKERIKEKCVLSIDIEKEGTIVYE